MRTGTTASGSLARAQQRGANRNSMKKKTEKRANGLRREYDAATLKNGVRGKYTARYRAGTNLVLLSPDVAKAFPDEQSVNDALRALMRAAKKTVRRAS